jgi:hypothetical protein
MVGHIVPLNELRTAYEAPRTGLERYVKPALDAFCALAAADPTNALPDNSISPLAKAGRDFFRDLCNPTNPPGTDSIPEPELPFEGGQCNAVYRIRFQIANLNGIEPPSNSEGFLRGPLTRRRNPPNSGGARSVVIVGRKISSNDEDEVLLAIIIPPGVNQPRYKYQNLSITRVDGQPDNCGNTGGQYPPNYNPPATPTDRPIPGLPGFPGLPNLPVVVVPVFLPPGLIAPVVNVNVGPFNITFDAGGVTIVPTIQIGPGGKIVPVPGTPTVGTNPTDYNKIKEFITDAQYALSGRFNIVDAQLAAIKKCACKEPVTLETTLQANTPSGSIVLSPTRNKYCAVKLTVIPINAKQQLGGNGPDVFYQGWAWFGNSDGYTSERMPIDARGKIFANTGNFNRFFWTCYTGTQCEVYDLNESLPAPALPPTSP